MKAMSVMNGNAIMFLLALAFLRRQSLQVDRRPGQGDLLGHTAPRCDRDGCTDGAGRHHPGAAREDARAEAAGSRRERRTLRHAHHCLADQRASPRQSPGQGQCLPGRQAFRANGRRTCDPPGDGWTTLETPDTGGEMFVTNVKRGTHTLQAEVVNRAGNTLIASQAVTFHVHEPSRLAPGGPPPPPKPDIYPRVYPPQPYPPTYKPVYPPQPYPPQGRPKPNAN